MAKDPMPRTKIPRKLGPEALALISARLKALGDGSRLAVLHELMDGEATVTELVERTGLTQANVSKHLQVLRRHAFVHRRREGLYAHYSIADPSVFELCDLMCRRIEEEARQTAAAFESTS